MQRVWRWVLGLEQLEVLHLLLYKVQGKLLVDSTMKISTPSINFRRTVIKWVEICMLNVSAAKLFCTVVCYLTAILCVQR